MKKLLFLLPVFIFAGLNNSYAYKKGYQEGMLIRQSNFKANFSLEEINKKCLKAWKKDSQEDYIKQNKDTFLKGCKEALSGF